MSRLSEWKSFAALVNAHIANYTIPQYGDAPGDPVESWTSQACVDQIKKYANRFGTGQRGHMETVRDLMKMAHYACLAYGKIQRLGVPNKLEAK